MFWALFNFVDYSYVFRVDGLIIIGDLLNCIFFIEYIMLIWSYDVLFFLVVYWVRGVF